MKAVRITAPGTAHKTYLAWLIMSSVREMTACFFALGTAASGCMDV